MNMTTAAFSVYLIIVFALGWMAWRQTQSNADFFLGGRRLGPWTTGLSACASDMSGWLLLGLPGLAYTIGLGASWLALGLLVGSWLNWYWIAPKLRQTSRASHSLTLPHWYCHRFPALPQLRLITALMTLGFYLLYTSAGFVAGAKLFSELLPVSYHTALLITVATISGYTLLGGFLAVSWSDVFQGLLMLAALLLLPVLAWQQLSTQPDGFERIREHSDLLFFGYDAAGRPFTTLGIISFLAWGLGYFGQPHILARFKAIKRPAALRAARKVGVAWTTLALGGAIACGVLGAMVLPEPLTDPETVFLRLIPALSHPFVGGILLAAVLAAIMSTADSQLLVCSATTSEDLLPTQTDSAKQRRRARLIVAALAVLAALIAAQPEAGVLNLVSFAWAGFGATFGPTLLLALHWPRTSSRGVLLGLLAGAAAVIGWHHVSGGWFDVYELAPAFVIACIVTVGGSLLWPDHAYQPAAPAAR